MNELPSTQTEADQVLEEFRAMGPDESKLAEFFRLNTKGELTTNTCLRFLHPKHGILTTVSGEANAAGFDEENPWISLTRDTAAEKLEIRLATSEAALKMSTGRRFCLALSHLQSGEAILYTTPNVDTILLNSPFGKWAITQIAKLAKSYPTVD